jgi:UDP-N-acetylglucosamine acyltransferase
MKRRGYSKETIKSLHRAFHLLLSSKLNTSQAVDRIAEELKGSAEVDSLVEFIQTSNRGVIK